MALLGADKLDRRLFNVSDLIEMGYDDAKTGSVPLIATYSPAEDPRRCRAGGARAAARWSAGLAGIHGAALTADKRQARTFWSAVAPSSRSSGAAARRSAPALAKLWLDGRVEGQPEGERAADRRARGLGGRVRRQGREGGGARHRHRCQPPRPGRPDRRHGKLRAG